VNGVLIAARRMDFRLQRRYGFWWATGFVVTLWIGVLQFVPDGLLPAAMSYLLMADIEFMLFLIAGAVFCETGERTLFALDHGPAIGWAAFPAAVFLMTALMVLAGFCSAPRSRRSASGSSPRRCCMVRTRRDGTRIFYALASGRVEEMWAAVRAVAEEHAAGLPVAAGSENTAG
jgi:hypothetical protein